MLRRDSGRGTAPGSGEARSILARYLTGAAGEGGGGGGFSRQAIMFLSWYDMHDFEFDDDREVEASIRGLWLPYSNCFVYCTVRTSDMLRGRKGKVSILW